MNHVAFVRTASLLLFAASATASRAAYKLYGDMDVLGTGTYASDPLAGAATSGLAPDATTLATLITPHSFPFSPSAGDYPGTDQIYVGSHQTSGHDGYSGYASRIAGPQILTMDYGSLIPAGQAVTGLTLGIGADDFQNAVFGQPFEAKINGVVNPTLTSLLNGFDETGPKVRFLGIGIAPSLLAGSNVLSLSIDEAGDGGDGWAVDYLTIGVTTQAVPEPAPVATLGLGAWAFAARRRRARTA